MNAESSRSHLLINLYLTSKASNGCMVHSKLCLADLAGAAASCGFNCCKGPHTACKIWLAAASTACETLQCRPQDA